WVTRTRCGAFVSWISRRKCPCASVLVRASSFIPCASASRTTSSPAAGLPVVPFFTVPVRVAAPAVIAQDTTASSISNLRVNRGPVKLSFKLDSKFPRRQGKHQNLLNSDGRRAKLPFQHLNFGQQGRGFVLECRPHCFVVGLRQLSRL